MTRTVLRQPRSMLMFVSLSSESVFHPSTEAYNVKSEEIETLSRAVSLLGTVSGTAHSIQMILGRINEMKQPQAGQPAVKDAMAADSVDGCSTDPVYEAIQALRNAKSAHVAAVVLRASLEDQLKLARVDEEHLYSQRIAAREALEVAVEASAQQ